MSDDTIALIRGVDRCPTRFSAPPFEVMLERIRTSAVADDPGSARGSSAPRRRGRRWRAAGGTPAMAVAVALVAVVVAVAGHGSNGRGGAAVTPGHRTDRPTIAATAGPRTWTQRLQASKRDLISELATLRRPQTAAERAFAHSLDSHGKPFSYYPGWSIDRRLVRDAITTPWGEHVYLIPLTPPTPQQVRRRHPANARTASPVEWLIVYPTDHVGWAPGNATQLRAGGLGESHWGPGGPSSGVVRGYELVPDGVAKITYILARQPDGSQYGDPIYPHVGRLTVPVYSNIAAWQARRAPGTTRLWYAADGRVLKRFGNPAAAARVVPVKQPGPETSRSRAAEHDPSTPNPVSVTPTIGGAHTRFVLHFRALLNDAAYGFHVTGHSCSGYQFAAGLSGDYATLHGDLRDDSMSATLTGFSNRALCPGTYHVAARVTDLEPIRTIRPVGRKVLAEPFGTTTFTVR
jgi:hypothetical protein